MKKAICQVITVALCLTLVACGPKPEDRDCPVLEAPKQVNDQQGAIAVDIAIDGTPSMQGFVNISDSEYIRTLRLTNSVLVTAFPNSSQTKYYRFGENKKELTSQKTALQSQCPSFYNDSNPLVIAQCPYFYDNTNPDLLKTNIEKAIEPIDSNSKNKLSIIITDLYQEKADFTPVTTRLKSYLKDGYAVGFLAVKSQYDGMVYDAGITEEQELYTTNPKFADKFRPFYVIALGTYENVARYFDKIKAQSQSEGLKFQDDQFVIFYSQLIQQPLSLSISGILEGKTGIERPSTINDGNIVVTVQNEQTTERLIIDDAAKDGEKIEYKIDYKPLAYTLPIQSFEVKITPDPKSTMAKLDNNKIEWMKFDNWKISEGQIQFDTSFFPTNMQSGVALLTADIIPKQGNEGYKKPNWWKKWNVSQNQLPKDQIPNNVYGSGTYNLLPFLEGLSEIALGASQSKDMPLGRFCYAIHRKSGGQ